VSLLWAIVLGTVVLVTAGGAYALLYWLFRHDEDEGER
jgi:hypothetical protein